MLWNSSDIGDEPFRIAEEAIITAEVVAILCAMLGGIWNFIAIITFISAKKLHKSTNYIFVCNLCVTYFLVCTILLPMQALLYNQRSNMFGEAFCNWLACIKFTLIGASLLSLCAIAINRYIHICHHTKQKQIFNKCVITIILLVVWVFPMVLSAAPLTGLWGAFGFEPRAISCTFSKDVNNYSHRIVMVALSVVLPMGFIIFCYSKIGVHVYQSRKHIQKWSSSKKQKQQRHENGEGTETSNLSIRSSSPGSTGLQRDGLRLTAIMLLIFIVHMSCCLPYTLVNIIDAGMTIPTLHVITTTIAWLQYIMNPIIYTVVNRPMRKSGVNLICCVPCRGGREYRSSFRTSQSVV